MIGKPRGPGGIFGLDLDTTNETKALRRAAMHAVTMIKNHISIFADGRFKSKRDARKGGIGYNTESNNAPSQTPSRAAAVNSLRTGMMAQFKSSFVAASPDSQNQATNNSNVYANKRPAMTGFVSGGTIGGDTNRPQATPTTNFTPASGGSIDYRVPLGGSGNKIGVPLVAGISFVLYVFKASFEELRGMLCISHVEEKDVSSHELEFSVRQLENPFGILNFVKKLKDEGNMFYKKNQMGSAIAKYSLALKMLSFALVCSEEDKLMFLGTVVSLNLNLGSCFIKVKDYDRVGQLCSAVLCFDTTNVKAYYRRAIAALGLNKPTLAFMDLAQAFKIDPNNKFHYHPSKTQQVSPPMEFSHPPVKGHDRCETTPDLMQEDPSTGMAGHQSSCEATSILLPVSPVSSPLQTPVHLSTSSSEILLVFVLSSCPRFPNPKRIHHVPSSPHHSKKKMQGFQCKMRGAPLSSKGLSGSKSSCHPQQFGSVRITIVPGNLNEERIKRTYHLKQPKPSFKNSIASGLEQEAALAGCFPCLPLKKRKWSCVGLVVKVFSSGNIAEGSVTPQIRSPGPTFTWTNGRTMADPTFERLDKAYATSLWLHDRLATSVQHQPILFSDHAAIILCDSLPAGRCKRPYRIENWCLHASELWSVDWKALVAEVCQAAAILDSHYSRCLFNSFMMEKIAEPQAAFLLWKQREKVKWDAFGEEHTQLLFSVVQAKKRRNTIIGLQDNAGAWVTDVGSIRTLALDFFITL
uniref:Uncharacterized protein n=1 Tax=Chenopodium quinoa TaxID=63459 RepID=A0A803LLY8_CHEQI